MFAHDNTNLGTDKIPRHHYHKAYAELFDPHKGTTFNVLEIGVAGGYSLYAWSLLFSHESRIVGVDIDPSKALNIPNVEVMIADATREEFAQGLKDESFHAIIDDGSHRHDDILRAFELLYPKVVPGGMYIVEDIDDLAWFNASAIAQLPHRIFDLRESSGVGDSVLVVVAKPLRTVL